MDLTPHWTRSTYLPGLCFVLFCFVPQISPKQVTDRRRMLLTLCWPFNLPFKTFSVGLAQRQLGICLKSVESPALYSSPKESGGGLVHRHRNFAWRPCILTDSSTVFEPKRSQETFPSYLGGKLRPTGKVVNSESHVKLAAVNTRYLVNFNPTGQVFVTAYKAFFHFKSLFSPM